MMAGLALKEIQGQSTMVAGYHKPSESGIHYMEQGLETGSPDVHINSQISILLYNISALTVYRFIILSNWEPHLIIFMILSLLSEA